MTVEQARALLDRIHRTNPWRYPADDLAKALIRWPTDEVFHHVSVRVYDRERPAHITFDTEIAWWLYRLALLPEPVNLPPEIAAQVADLEAQLTVHLEAAIRLVLLLLQLRPRS
jgi:hypothetical protein